MINRFRGKRRHRYRSMFYAFKKQRGGGGKIRVYNQIQLPVMLAIHMEKYRSMLLTAIQSIHRSVRKGLTDIELDFSRTRKIYSDAMLWLYAEINNIQNINKDVRFSCKKPYDEKVSHVLHQIGIYRICREKFTPNKQFSDVIYWRTCAGKQVIAEEYDHLVGDQHDLFHPEIDLFGGCVEATKNARKHAYIDRRELSPVQHDETAWWIFSQIKDGNMYVSVCDLGIGIAATLPRSRAEFFFEIVKKFQGKTTSADLIAAALETSKSRTGKDYHGNGLPKIASVVQKTKQGILVIHSHDGYVEIAEGEKNFHNYKTKIPGTIVSWTLPVRTRDEQKDHSDR